MSTLMHLVAENYYDLLEAEKDPVINSWSLMSSPWPTVTLLIAYLYFVLKLGPQLMQNRKPFTLKWVLIAYNAYQVAFSAWLCSLAIKKDILYFFFNNSCTNYGQDVKLMVNSAAWWYFVSKMVELLDTVFFVLRKKQSQVTFLHVYHHSAMALFSWGYLRFAPGEQGILIGLLNCLVHVVMYTYYLIAALGPKFHKYLWWKKYMTWIQLIQFVMMLAYLAYIVSLDCNHFSRGVTTFFVTNVVIYLYLFSDFYKRAYKKPKKVMDSTRENKLIKIE